MTAQATAFGVGGVLALVCLAVLCVPSAFPVRGAVQRVAELIQFTGVFCVCLLLSRTEAPNERLALAVAATLAAHRRPLAVFYGSYHPA